jgi:hypothetical protein
VLERIPEVRLALLFEVRTHREASLSELQAERDAAELVAFALLFAVQACGDIAGHFIADENGRSREASVTVSHGWRIMG